MKRQSTANRNLAYPPPPPDPIIVKTIRLFPKNGLGPLPPSLN